MRLKTRSKFNAKRTEVDGIVFDSKREARRYMELRLRERAGNLRALELQPRFALKTVPEVGEVAGAWPIIGEYVADFRYEEVEFPSGLAARPYSTASTNPGVNIKWNDVVEDVKGMKTALYRWKKKHVEAQYGITIREI